MQECIIIIKKGFIIFVQVVYVFVDDLIDFVFVIIFVYLDVIIVLFCGIFELGIYFVVDFFDFKFCMFDFCIVGQEYYDIVSCVQQIFQEYKFFQDIIVIFGMDEFFEVDKFIVECVCKIQCFLSQFFIVVQVFIGIEGVFVDFKDIIVFFKVIFNGEGDNFFEGVFYMVGDFVFVKVKGEKIMVEFEK